MRETLAAKDVDTAAPQRVPGNICAFTTSETVFTQEEIILAHLALQVKDRAMINRVRSNMICGGRSPS